MVAGRPRSALSLYLRFPPSYLNNNLLSGTIPSSIGSLTNLKYVYVRGSSGHRPFSTLSLASLHSELPGNQLSGTLPASLGNLKNMLQLCVRRFDHPSLFAEPLHAATSTTTS